jgi:hypothetical protein
VLQALILFSGLNLHLVADARELAALDVSIAVFDPGVPADASVHRDLQVFPRIREIEARLLPFVLRDTLSTSNAWGAVRVVPEPDVAAELLVSGTIIRSDGESLGLEIRAVDASGRVWLDQTFAGLHGSRQLYDDIAEGLLLARGNLDDKALADIAEISLLRYANQLAPSAFGDYLDITPDGTFLVQRLPANNDPMLDRIERIRSTEYVITDTVDEKFQQLHGDIASIYDLWREYRRKAVKYQMQDANRAQNTRSDAPRGSYEAMLILYENYKSDRIIAQEQDRLAVAFNNEVGPKVDAMEIRVAELEDWVDQKYAEWHRLLEELFEAETAFEP